MRRLIPDHLPYQSDHRPNPGADAALFLDSARLLFAAESPAEVARLTVTTAGSLLGFANVALLRLHNDALRGTWAMGAGGELLDKSDWVQALPASWRRILDSSQPWAEMWGIESGDSETDMRTSWKVLTPLRTATGVIGILVNGDSVPNDRPDDARQQVLAHLATLAAAAIERLENATQHDHARETLTGLTALLAPQNIPMMGRLRRLLELGCGVLSLEGARLCRVRRHKATVLVAWPEVSHESTTSDITDATGWYRDLLANPEPIEATGIGRISACGHPGLGGNEAGVFVGCRVEAFGKVFGSLVFFGNAARVASFTQSERDMVRHLALVAGQVIESERTRDELQTLREQTEVATRGKCDFIASMTREIRTPVTHMLGMSQEIAETLDDDTRRDLQQRVRRSGETLLTMLNDVVDYTRIEAGRLTLQEVAFDPASCVEEVAEKFAAEAHSRHLDLVIDLHPGLPRVVMGDPARFSQAISVLVSNAIKFTPHGHVMIVAKLQEMRDRVGIFRISVMDSGSGVDVDMMPRLFQPFSRPGSPATRTSEGMGIGLALGHRIVEAMGGSIAVDPNTPDCSGATFHLTLPFAVVQGPESYLVKSRRTLLLVGPGAATRIALERSLAERGYDLLQAEDASTAVDILTFTLERGVLVQGIIVDHDLGEPVASAITAEYSARGEFAPRMILLAGHAGVRGPHIGSEFTGVVTKPLTRRQVATMLSILRGEDTWSSIPDSFAGIIPTGQPNGRIVRVLVVEDNEVNMRVATRLLERSGYDVRVARNGREALELLQNDPVDLVLLDCQMPVMDGYETVRHIRAAEAASGLPRLPVIAMTAHGLDADRERCHQAGMDDYLLKPVGKAELQACLKRHLHPATTEPA